MDKEDHLVQEKPIQSGIETITKLLLDPEIIKIVTVLDTVSLSILELLEYNISRRDISHALADGVIEIDKRSFPSEEIMPRTAETILVSDDVFYYRYLSNKVRLTELGKLILASLKAISADQDILDRARVMFDSGVFNPPDHPVCPI